MKHLFRNALMLVAAVAVTLSASQCCGKKSNSRETIAKSIDKYVQEVKQDWNITGMAVCFSLDDSILLAKGYGVKDMNKPADDPENQITPETRFQIGSVSKSFTALVVSSMVEEGLLNWEDTVKNILPDFQMYDPWVTANMQVKDIMTHHTGLPDDYGSYLPNLGYDRHQVYKMLARLKPCYTYRGDYQYNNMTFLIASEMIEKLTGKTWEQNVQERVFDKIGMSASSMNKEGFEAPGNVAVPHAYDWDHGLHQRALYGDDQALWWLTVIGPAGGISSNVLDLNKYAKVQRTNGLLNGERIYPEKVLKDVHEGYTICSQDSTYIRLYGHCWFIEQNNRYKLFFHTGTTWGFTCICFYVPEIGLSGAMLCNDEIPSDPRYAIMRRLIDLVMGAPANGYDEINRDYNKEYHAEWLESRAKRDEKRDANAVEPVAEPADAATAIVGTYKKDALFGDAVISQEDGKFFITIGPKNFKRELIHKSDLSYIFWCDGHDFTIHFNREGSAKANGFIIEFANGEEKDLGGWYREGSSPEGSKPGFFTRLYKKIF